MLLALNEYRPESALDEQGMMQTVFNLMGTSEMAPTQLGGPHQRAESWAVSGCLGCSLEMYQHEDGLGKENSRVEH